MGPRRAASRPGSFRHAAQRPAAWRFRAFAILAFSGDRNG
ncbi:hypothetical protein SAMN04487976_103349 [Xaviernesmea oryzae]|nr:hypothetical protein SAMN04487976_103349 [Xaviernesmea oryzae]